MPDTITDHLSAGQLADRAANAIHELNRRTHPTSKDLVYPADAAEIIATLAAMTGMLGQLLTQLTRWLAHQHRDGRLTLDSLSPQPDLASAMRALTSSLQHAIEQAQHTATELDTAHQHAAHLAAAQPATKRSKPQHQGPGPKFMQIGGAKTLDETHQVVDRLMVDLPTYRCDDKSVPGSVGETLGVLDSYGLCG